MKNCFFASFLSAALSLLSFSVVAQVVVSYGPKVGLGLSNVITELDTDVKPAFAVGGIVEFGFTDNFLLSSEIQFCSKGYRDGNENSTYKLELYYVQMPVSVNFMKGRFFFGAGTYVGIATSGKGKLTLNGDTTTINQISFGSGRENFKRLDYGLRGEVGYRFSRWRFGIFYEHGLADVLPEVSFASSRVGVTERLSGKNQWLGLSAAWLF